MTKQDVTVWKKSDALSVESLYTAPMKRDRKFVSADHPL
jgi:hypothetical protein